MPAKIVQSLPKMGRMARRPSHTWHVRQKPFIIQPVCIAPVLPGETMKNLLFQSRVITEGIANPLIGWHQEYYWFYVRHRQLSTPADFEAMVLEYNKDMSTRYGAAKVATYHADSSSIDWVQECLNVVVTEYFRDDGEDHTDHLVDNMPICKAHLPGWMDSLDTAADIEANAPGLPDDAANATMEEIDKLRLQWEFLQANNITNMDYHDFLRSYGVRLGQTEDNKPELLRYVREWTYPASTVDGSSGAVSSVCSWAISERADKDRFFKEPGFVFGASVTRPKVYYNNVRTAGVSMMQDAFRWLPAMLRDEVAVSLKNFAAAAGPLPNSSGEYVVDVKDLLMYGDQFVNFDLSTESGYNEVVLPSADLSNKAYVSSADIDNLFTGGTPTALVKQDGRADFTFMGSQQDTSPQTATVIR